MATGPRKPPTPRSTLAGRGSDVPKRRGRPPGKAAAARQKTAPPPEPAIRKKAAMKQAPVRKTARIPAPPQARVPRKVAAGRGAVRKGAALAEQVERINDGMGAIADLLGEVQGLRARFDAFAQRIEALLTTQTANPLERVDPPQTEESYPAPAEEPHRTSSPAGEDVEPAETDDTPPEAST